MKALFKEKISKFGSLISLLAVTAMLAVFSLALPEFLASAAGRFFAGAWAVIAIGVFIAHARRLSDGHKRYPAKLFRAAGGKAGRREEKRTPRIMRG